MQHLTAPAIADFITSQIEFSRSRMDFYKNNGSHHEHTLKENRIIIAGGIRQTGSTSVCASIFNPKSDWYITSNKMMWEELCIKMKNLEKITSRNEVNKCLMKSNEYMNSLRGRSIYEDAVIWIDLGNCLHMDRADDINKIIEMIECTAQHHNTIYVIL